MKVTRLIIRGIPYKLVKAPDLRNDDPCDLCSLSEICLRKDDQDAEDPRYLCDMGGRADPYTFFIVDLDIDKTIKEVKDDEL